MLYRFALLWFVVAASGCSTRSAVCEPAPLSGRWVSHRADNGTMWSIRATDDLEGAGPNRWHREAVTIDKHGLRIDLTPIGSNWYAGEAALVLPPGYLDASWRVIGPVGQLDPNVIVGVFVYRDDRSELDFELGRWGDVEAANAQFVVAPASSPSRLHRFRLPSDTERLDVQLRWRRDVVSFAASSENGAAAAWEYRGPQRPTPCGHRVHFNVWLFQGRRPTSPEPISIRFTEFFLVTENNALLDPEVDSL
ncbi:MAG: hypothetical protein AAFZ38_12330 [Myxococcota bacterium]